MDVILIAVSLVVFCQWLVLFVFVVLFMYNVLIMIF